MTLCFIESQYAVSRAVSRMKMPPVREYASSLLICDQGTTLEKVQKRACKIILGKNYNSYTNAIETCELDTPSDRRKIHSRKFAQTLPNCKRTSSLIPPTKRSVHGRDLRNSNSVTLLPCRTERFRKSPILYFTDLLNNRF